jgi:hypothetical protein
MTRVRIPLAFAVPLAYAAGLWLVLIYKVAGQSDGTQPRFVLHWLRDATLALPVVLVAVLLGLTAAGGMLERRGNRLSHGLTRAVTTAAVALAAGAAMGVALPIRNAVFGSHDAVSLPLPLHMLRDALLALFVTVPVSAAVVALRRARTAEPAVAEPGARTTSRAAFLKAGAGGLVTVAGGAGVLRAVSTPSATAAASTVKVSLLINEGYCKMTDGTPVWMRGFAYDGVAKAPVVPGPAIGPPYASVDYGEVPFVLEGQSVEVTITNKVTDTRSFFIPGVVGPIFVAAGETKTFTFNAPAAPNGAGSYIYMDADPIQRALGLHGAMVVMPADYLATDPASRRPYVNRPDLLPAPTFHHQFLWVFHDIDPVWGYKAKTGQTIDLSSFMPRYFTINGVSGAQSVESGRNLATGTVIPTDSDIKGEGSLYRIVNAGLAFHSPHFHGNHVYILTQNGQVPNLGGVPARSSSGEPLAVEKDVFGIQSLGRFEVLLPFHEPLDQWPPYYATNSPNYRYPMHCHAEMSQTAGGGQYPSGMYTEWELSGPLGPPKAIGG